MLTLPGVEGERQQHLGSRQPVPVLPTASRLAAGKAVRVTVPVVGKLIIPTLSGRTANRIAHHKADSAGFVL